jgi:hypothetical protein
MPSTSTAFGDEANVTIQRVGRPPVAPARSRAQAKGAATVQRNARERRASRLADIRAQIANGTLVVRQMTPAERGAGSGAPRRRPGRRAGAAANYGLGGANAYRSQQGTSLGFPEGEHHDQP